MKLLSSFTRSLSPHGCGGAAHCFFSTWRAEASFPIALAYTKANYTLVLSDPPPHPGKNNVNLQLITSSAGIRAAKSVCATHAIKMRGDLHLSQPSRFIEKVVGFPPKLTTVTWIGYMTDYVVAGPIADLEELFSPLQGPGDDRFAELFLAEQFAFPRGWTQEQFCRSLAFWVDKEGDSVGGAHALPRDMLFWSRGGTHTSSDDLATALRDMITYKDPCLNQLPMAPNPLPSFPLFPLDAPACGRSR